MTPAQRVKRIRAEATGADLSSWEKFEFLPSIEDKLSLSIKQEKVLFRIEVKLELEDDE